ncbi:MAG: trypsin-like peptidase domain-containing protein [Candidatus Woesearchaeota archaeon]|jgi:S1-C subfamily serine protease|nr:trypsin-like peptidase domain-containing protein [Candidatus Woesearchaeota archaeon]MDP7181170.1 trypsin-like peptidase domain-containing protein [Candidatus Woesearchaeota archaeon]MDP7198209.1 trypsin-like peptidase domain-containing protein [Candidatus Woesearchaeota archaeon]MDP7467045.1 trypsin-like peptidase domain-containing protein [Candidatus Woesearchaeota archaeon]MDP7646713.1 trypsin-like peptidase domain-containing protein [Candidatus Woesearchaeota archaeon]
MRALVITWVVLAVLLISAGWYGQTVIQDLKNNDQLLATATQQGFDTLTQSIGTINKNVGTLETRVAGAEKGLAGVGVKVAQVQELSEQGISSLTGQLNLQQELNNEKLSALEDKIVRNVRSGDLTGMIDRAIKSVVSVNTDVGLGSGVFIRPGGLIVTNAHVVKDAGEGSVRTLDGEIHSVSIVGTNPAIDIAVLRINGDYPYLDFSRSATIGEKVVGMGNPGGLSFTVTEGIVSAVDRIQNGVNYVQTDVPINPGNSGGPLINAVGDIVGINTLKIKGFEGVGFAISAQQVDDTIDQIIRAAEASD